MLFPTFQFALFLLPVLLGSWLLNSWHNVNKAWLLCASYLFYAAWSPGFCLLIAASSIANHCAAHEIWRTQGRRCWWTTTLAIATNLGVLAWYKYAAFAVVQIDNSFALLGMHQSLPVLEVVLPIGVSFFTFHAISYVVDVYRGTIAPARSLLDAMLYVAFFPHLVAGPIVRAAYFLPQLENARSSRDIKLAAALVLIVTGLFKKVLLADYLATELVDPVFLDPAQHSAPDLWIGMYAYAVQIYCDFSGYTDMATGIAALFGYSFPRNFNRPYRSLSLGEFWTRWHISLSSWLRDYLYIPLGGNRVGPLRGGFNLLATMVLGGLWHGASWTFVLWGLLHGLALVVAKLWRWRVTPVVAWLLTFHVVCLGWVLFRSPDMATAWTYLAGMTGGNWSSLGAGGLACIVVLLGVAAHGLGDWMPAISKRVDRLHWSMQATLAGLAVVLFSALGPDGVAPFIYFAF